MASTDITVPGPGSSNVRVLATTVVSGVDGTSVAATIQSVILCTPDGSYESLGDRLDRVIYLLKRLCATEQLALEDQINSDDASDLIESGASDV